MSNQNLTATLEGYVAGIAEHGENPYHYLQEEAWCWEHGHEQGRQHRIACVARETVLPKPQTWYTIDSAWALLDSLQTKPPL